MPLRDYADSLRMKNGIELHALDHQTFDLIVIGGGINGAGIARDAVMRGLKTLLLEKGDFASGTSSHSSRLVHGGVRYLEQLDFKLVFEACQERHRLRALAPHLVWPLPFLIPVYQKDRRQRWQYKIGLTLYDLLALFRNVENHQSLSKAQLLEREPNLNPEGLKGGMLYWDAQMNDARLCLENILSAEQHGAICLNYAQVVSIDHIKHQEYPFVVAAQDQQESIGVQVRSKCVVNAAGPWVDDILKVSHHQGERRVRRTKGVHIFVPRLTQKHALLLSAQMDGRVFFVMPWEKMTYIGTTDTDYHGDLDVVAADDADIDYLQSEALHVLKGVEKQIRTVTATYSGLRSLVNVLDGKPSSVTREHQIPEIETGFFAVVGGKYTTYRLVAEQTVNKVVKYLGLSEKTKTKDALLYGSVHLADHAIWRTHEKERLVREHGLAEVEALHVLDTYGIQYEKVIGLIRLDTSLGERLHPDKPNLKAEVLYALENEKAKTISDILWRRMTFNSNFDQALIAANSIAQVLDRHLSWSKEKIDSNLKEVHEFVQLNMACISG